MSVTAEQPPPPSAASELQRAWSNALDAFDRDLRRRAVASKTLKAYGIDGAQFAAWASANELAPRQVEVRALRRYAASLTARGQAPATVARKLAALRGMFRAQVELGERAENPAELVSSPKKRQRHCRARSEEERECEHANEGRCTRHVPGVRPRAGHEPHHEGDARPARHRHDGSAPDGLRAELGAAQNVLADGRQGEVAEDARGCLRCCVSAELLGRDEAGGGGRRRDLGDNEDGCPRIVPRGARQGAPGE